MSYIEQDRVSIYTVDLYEKTLKNYILKDC